MQPLRVAVVSDDPLARGGLLALLAGQESLVVVGARPSADLEGLRALGAEAILFDSGAGSEALRPLAALAPVVAIVAGEEQAATAFRAGARALLLRDSSGERLAAALHGAAHGLLTLDRALAGWLRPVTVPLGEGLTPRELEVLSLLAEGLPNKIIAERLGTSERTAKFHVESILSKLGAENRSEAIVLAARRGLVVL
jgi:two-component system, NarL family, nitrate/nitrite response regulator NarL